MEEKYIKMLAKHRVKQDDIVKELLQSEIEKLSITEQVTYNRLRRQQATNNFHALKMTKDEIIERRAYMRQILKNTKFSNGSNDTLDLMRVYDVPGYGYMVEDAEGYETIIFGSTFNYGEFRKACAMVPFEYMDKKASDFDFDCYNCDTKELKDTVNKFIVNFENFRKKGYGVYIQSREKGTGKTMLACILLNEISIRYAVNVKFVTIYNYLEMTKKSYNGTPEKLQEINNAQVLVIDDLGANMRKEWIETVLFTLIDKRYINNLITIYTSNIPLNELDIDNRIVSRIQSRSFIASIPDVPVRKISAEKQKAAFLKDLDLKSPSITGHNQRGNK